MSILENSNNNEKDGSLLSIGLQLNGQNYDYRSYVMKKNRMWSYASY